MSAIPIFGTLENRLLYVGPRSSRPKPFLLSYLPSIVLTIVGVTISSVCWISVLNAAPERGSLILLASVQLAWLASLTDVWLQNTHWVFRKDHTATSDASLRGCLNL